MTVASIAYQQGQYRQMKAKMEAEAEKRKGQKFTIQGEAAPLPVVYGKQLIGGIKTKHKVSGSYTQATMNADRVLSTGFDNTSRSAGKNEYLIVQTALCHDGIESVEHVLVNDIDYRGYTNDMKENKAEFNHRFHFHYDGGTADAGAIANGIDSANLFTNTAYCTSFYKLNRDNPQYSGSPNAQYIVKGRKVRTITESGGNYTLSSTYTYSNNPAYCLLDYLLNSEFGRGLTTNQVDLQSFYDAAQICDTTVMTGVSIGGSVNGAKPVFSYTTYNAFPQEVDAPQANYLFYAEDTEKLYSMTQSNGTPTYTEISVPLTGNIKLYECNITLNTEATIRDNIQRILASMGTADFVWTPQGKYKLILSYPTSSNELNNLINSNHYFTDDDIIREETSISWPSATDRFTQVTVNFDNEFEEFKPDSVTWPLKTSSVYTSYLAADNNNPLTTSLSAEGITDPYHAKALAEQTVRKSRSIYTINLTVTKKGLTVEPGDYISVTSDSLNLNNAIFRVEGIKVESDFTVKISAFYFDYTMLAWNIADDVDYAIRPNIDFSVSPPTNLSFSSSSNDILGTSSGKLSWTAANDGSVRDYLIEVSPDQGTTWNSLGFTSATSFDLFGFVSGVYDFSVRSRSVKGLYSERALIEDNTIQLKTVSKVLTVYADGPNAATNSQSKTLTTQTYVAYYVYDGDEPSLPITTGITFAKFVGDKGDKGDTGDNGLNVATVTLYHKNQSSTAAPNAP